MKKFLIRTATGAAFVAVLLGAILYGKTSFGILFAAVTAMSVLEFCRLINGYKNTTFSKALAVAGGVYLNFAVFAACHCACLSTMALFLPYILIVAYAFVRQLFDTRSNPLDNYAYFVLSQVYAALPFALLNLISTAGAEPGTTYSWLMPISIFIFIWCNDSGAFCVGCTMGRHKMFERVSPKKTWEGFFGGVAVAVAAGIVMSRFFTIMNIWEWTGMALTVAVSGTLGDLVESSMKREMQIKDSGNILPGHGGMLDRFDSTLLAVPCVVIYLSLIGIL
jgi:phosphatidate cytidylyltransferase